MQTRLEEGCLTGILNGIDPLVWNPAQDPYIPRPYQIDGIKSKADNKRALQKKFGLPEDESILLFSVVSRLTVQKGLDWLARALPKLIEQGGQLVLLGSGDIEQETLFREIASKYPKSVAIEIGYDEEVSHLIIAGSDVIVIPSRFEPCGLTQLYGLRYGTLPLVRHTGGLADTVKDCSLENLAQGTANGFVFYTPNETALQQALSRAFVLWDQPNEWRRVQYTAMGQDFSWHRSAQNYLSLYQQLV